MTDADKIMRSMDATATIVALYSGYRSSFIAAGWSPQGAEQMTLEILRAAVKST